MPEGAVIVGDVGNYDPPAEPGRGLGIKRRRWPWIVLAAVALLVLAHAALWWTAERAMARGFAEWQAGMAAQGWEVKAAGSSGLSGWPLAATRTLSNVEIGAGPMRVRSEHLAISVSLLQPATLRVTLPAPVTLALPLLPPLRLTAEEASLEAPLRGIPRADFDTRGLTAEWSTPDGSPQRLTAAIAHMRFVPTTPGLVIEGSAQAITLPEPPPGEILPLGSRLASVSFDATLHGSLPGPLLDTSTLATWRDAGGDIVVQRLALGYGPLGLSGNGRVGLDERLQPSGEAKVQVLGYAETLKTLTASHVMTAHAAQAIGAVLALLARPPEGGGAPQVDANVSLQNRTLTVAGFPILQLPAIAWPSGG